MSIILIFFLSFSYHLDFFYQDLRSYNIFVQVEMYVFTTSIRSEHTLSSQSFTKYCQWLCTSGIGVLRLLRGWGGGATMRLDLVLISPLKVSYSSMLS